MNAKKARQRRRQQREREAAIARGEIQPERSERVRALRLRRDARLAEVNQEFQRELHALYDALATNKKAIWDDYHASVRSLDVVEAAEQAEAAGIVVAPASTDLDAVAERLTDVTGRPVSN